MIDDADEAGRGALPGLAGETLPFLNGYVDESPPNGPRAVDAGSTAPVQALGTVV